MNLAEFAEFMGVSKTTVVRAVADGMPVVQRGGRKKPYKIDAEAAKRWWTARKGEQEKLREPADVTELRGKALREEYLAQREAIRLAKDRGQVLDRDEVADAVQAQLTMLRQDLLALPDKVAKRLGLDRKGRAVVEELVSAALHQAADRLSVLSNYEEVAAK